MSHSIFISYARSDGRELARRLRDELGAAGFTLWQDVVDMEAGETWWLQITEAIDRSAVMVLALTKAALASDVVRDEWDHARTVGTHVIPVTADAALLDDAPRWTRKVDVVVLDEGSPDYEVTRSRFLKQLEAPPPRRPRPFTVPSLPLTFVERPRQLDWLRAQVVDSRRHSPIATRVALQGGAGFGKTTLAIALCHDQSVRSAFDDGTVWVQFREQTSRPDAVSLLNDQIRLLDPEAQILTDVVQASARFRELVAERDLLVVLDDVWDEEYVVHFALAGRACLITTRLQRVVTRAGAAALPVDELQPEEAADLLAKWAKYPPSADDAARLRQLADSLGEWPLLLELVGAELRSLVAGTRTLADAVDHVTRRLDRRGFTYLDRDAADNRNAALAESLNASLALLPASQRDRFRELGILADDTNLPFESIGQLWAATGGYDALDTEDALEAMQRLALFTRYDAGARFLRLHDIVRRVAVEKLGDTRALHRALIGQWGQDLHDLPDDYAWRNVAYHLREAGRADELRSLLFDLDWIHAKLRATDPVALGADYASEPGDTDCRLLAAVLGMAGTSLSDPAQVSTQLVGRLGRVADPDASIRRLLARAAEFEGEPALVPVRANLPSVEQGVHRTVRTESPVLASVLTPDRSKLVIALADGTAQIWDWHSDKRGRTLQCGVGPVFSLAVDGRLLAVGGRHDAWSGYARPETPVEVWDWTSGTRVRSLAGDLADTRDGYATHLREGLLAVTTGAMNNLIHLYDWVGGELLGVVDPDEIGDGSTGNRPGAVTMAGPYLLYQYQSSNRIDVWTVADRAFCGTTLGDIGPDAAAFFSGRRLVVRSRWTERPSGTAGFLYPVEDPDGWLDEGSSGTLDVWRYDEPVSAVAEDGDHLYTCFDTIDVRDATSADVVQRLEGHSAPISSIEVLDDVTLTTSFDRTLRIWDPVERGRRRSSAPARFYRPPIASIAVHGASAFVGTRAGMLEEWDWRTGHRVDELALRNPVQALDVNERWVVCSHFESLKWAMLRVAPRAGWAEEREPTSDWTRRDGFEVRGGEFDFLERAVVMARVCGDSCAVVVQSYHTPANSIGWAPGSYTGNSIYVLDLAASDAELVVGEWISAVALSDGLVAGGTVEGNVDLWDRADGAPLQRFGGHSGGVTALAFHDGCLLSGSVDRTVRIWNLSTFAEVGTIGHGGGVRALSAHGDVLLTASDDHTLRLFAWKSGRELARFTDDASLDACALAPDLRAVVAGGLSGQLHVLRPNHALAERLTGG